MQKPGREETTTDARTRIDEVMPDTPSREATVQRQDTFISFGSFRLDRAGRLLLKDGVPVRIGSRALDLLIVLTDRAGEVVSRHALLDLVWRDVVVDEAAVRVHIASLRRALGDGQDGARYIVNVAGRGYSFVAPITQVEPEASQAAASTALRATIPPPAPPRPLIGRDRVIESLSELLLARRFVSIIGAGGIGKTSVATAITDRLRTQFGEENVVFTDLGAISEAALVPGAIIAAVGCTLSGADPATGLLDFLADKRMLIVLDSCEHLIDAASRLAADLFRQAPGVHLLVTSRESLRVAGETVHLLSALASPVEDVPSAAEALATPAVQLFMERAASGGFLGALTDGDAPIVAEICRRTDGIALGIELAASRVGTYGIRGVADLLAGSAELRLVGRRNVAPRHRTLQAMLDWSYNLLSEEERRILARLSVFIGLFTMEAACAVAGEAEPATPGVAAIVASLVDKSLLWVDAAEGRVFYRLLDMTRVYAAAKLEEFGEGRQVALRHARHFAELFRKLALEHGAYAEIGRHAPHVGNLRKALEWSFAEQEHRAIGVDLAADAAPLFLGLWLLGECRRWSRLALDSIPAAGGFSQREARLLEALAVSSMHTRGNTDEVSQAIERGLNLAEEDGAGLPQMRLLAGLNLFLTRLGHFDSALAAARRSAAIAERSGALSDRIIAEWLLAAAHHIAGNQAEALEHCQRGFTLEAGLGRLEINLFGYDHRLRASIGLARLLWLRGSPETACRLALEVIEEGARLPPPGNYSMATAHAIPILLWSGRTAEAAEHLELAIVHSERHSLRPNAAWTRALKGEWQLLEGNPVAAADTLREAIAALRREQQHMVLPAASRAMAEALARTGRHDEARATIEEALSSAQALGQVFWLPDLLRTQGEIMLRRPHPDAAAAEALLRRSIGHARDQAASGWELKAALPLARLLRRQGRQVEAHAILEAVWQGLAETSGSADLVEAAEILVALRS